MWVPLSIVRCFDKHRMIDYDRMNLISLNLILSSEVRWQGALGMVWIPKEICHPFFVFKGSYSMWVNYSLHWYGIKIKLGLCHLVKTTCFGVSIIECVCVISFEIYCIWPENGIHIAYVYITTFHFWSSDAKLPFKSSWNSPIFPIFFPSKCHPAIQLLHFNFPPLKLPVFEKEKFTPLKKNGKKTDTYDPPGWMGKPNVTAREWLSRSVLGMPCFPYTRWPVDCYPHGEPRSLEVERVSVTSCNCGQKIGHLSFFQKWNLLGKWMFLGKL